MMKFTHSLGAQLNVNPFAVIASNIAYMTSKILFDPNLQTLLQASLISKILRAGGNFS